MTTREFPQTADEIAARLAENSVAQLENTISIINHMYSRMQRLTQPVHRHICPEIDGGCGAESACTCLDVEPEHAVRLCDECLEGGGDAAT